MSSFSLKNFLSKDKENKQRVIPTIEVPCPSCHAVQTVSEGAISALCKNCKRIFDVKKALEKPADQHKQPTIDQQDEKENYTQDSKKIRCSGCQTWQDVPVIAISAFCKKCGQRINLQDYKKNNFFRGDLDTKGTLFITATGEVHGTVNVGEAVIEGKFKGVMIAERVVRLEPGSLFHGELYAPSVSVSDGAAFVGQSEVDPKKMIINEE
ncbi:MAG: polymer-forming cytoskeletal protein [Candidatus Auribacterota bacterium]|jgi:hypothetical protein|uniref:Polymer-forming cytoskeletal protein n=1 Tax=Candidatus Auribacter fodinae TaxID=2093366 RepID=A0A3A4R6K9_9BACT|nr:MAG: polymer-forming cytoskeletal protein [Candidatus Auribacter fodinae]